MFAALLAVIPSVNALATCCRVGSTVGASCGGNSFCGVAPDIANCGASGQLYCSPPALDSVCGDGVCEGEEDATCQQDCECAQYEQVTGLFAGGCCAGFAPVADPSVSGGLLCCNNGDTAVNGQCQTPPPQPKTCSGGSVCSVEQECECPDTDTDGDGVLEPFTWNGVQCVKYDPAEVCAAAGYAYQMYEGIMQCVKVTTISGDRSAQGFVNADACQEVVTGTGINFVCAAVWTTNNTGAQPPDQVFMDNELRPINENIPAEKMRAELVCKSGQPVPIIKKWDPHYLDWGSCNWNQCYYADINFAKGACLPISEYRLQYVCENRVNAGVPTGEGVWSTRTQTIADFMYDTASTNSWNEFTIHCDKYSESLNFPTVPLAAQGAVIGAPNPIASPYINQFCALVSGGKTKAIGVSLNYDTLSGYPNQQPDPTLRPTFSILRGEINFPPSPLPPFIDYFNKTTALMLAQQASRGCDNVLLNTAGYNTFQECNGDANRKGRVFYNVEDGLVVFTTDETFNPQPSILNKIWNWVNNLWGQTSGTPQQLYSLTGESVYYVFREAGSNDKIAQGTLQYTAGSEIDAFLTFQNMNPSTLCTAPECTQSCSGTVPPFTCTATMIKPTQQQWEKLTLGVRP